MSTVTPPPPSVPTAPVSGLVSTTALVLGAPPQTLQALQALQAGQSVQASITAQPTANQVQVQTSLGLVTLQTTMTLPRGAVLTLVRTPPPPSTPPNTPGSNATAPLTFQISTVNGKPVATGQQATATPPVAPPLAAGQTVTATLLRPAVAIAQGATQGTATQGATVQSGTTQAGITQGTTTQGASPTGASPTPANPGTGPTAQGTPSPASLQGSAARTLPASTPGTVPNAQPSAPSQPAGSAPSAPSTTPATPTTTLPTTTLPSGTRFSATVQRVETPNAAVTTPGSLTAAGAGAKALAPGQVLVGTVFGRTAGSLPIVQTPSATFALGSPGATGTGALGEGTKITFRLDSAPLAPTATGAALRPPGAAHGLINAKSWDDLGEALKALAGADPARLTQVAQHTLPQPGAKLTSQMLFFLSALKGGDLRGLFGDSAMRVIDKERPNLLSRLGSDFQTMARLADEPQQGDWRLALIPLWNGEKLDQLRFFWRGTSPEEGGEEGEETRFVFDLDFSQLGHMQIDGLVKAKRRHVDLIVRTDQPLPADMRATIAEIFEDARDTLGLGGQVAFQAAPGNFITVPGAEPQTAPHAPNGMELPNLLA